MKQCKKCGLLKKLDEYYIQKTNKTGLTGNCRECILAYQSTPKVRARCRVAEQKYADSNPKKRRAKTAIMVEIRRGRMKSKPCYCGEIKTEGHHPNYNYPLSVLWLCVEHHNQWHKYAKPIL